MIIFPKDYESPGNPEDPYDELYIEFVRELPSMNEHQVADYLDRLDDLWNIHKSFEDE